MHKERNRFHPGDVNDASNSPEMVKNADSTDIIAELQVVSFVWGFLKFLTTVSS